MLTSSISAPARSMLAGTAQMPWWSQHPRSVQRERGRHVDRRGRLADATLLVRHHEHPGLVRERQVAAHRAAFGDEQRPLGLGRDRRVEQPPMELAGARPCRDLCSCHGAHSDRYRTRPEQDVRRSRRRVVRCLIRSARLQLVRQMRGPAGRSFVHHSAGLGVVRRTVTLTITAGAEPATAPRTQEVLTRGRREQPAAGRVESPVVELRVHRDTRVAGRATIRGNTGSLIDALGFRCPGIGRRWFRFT